MQRSRCRTQLKLLEKRKWYEVEIMTSGQNIAKRLEIFPLKKKNGRDIAAMHIMLSKYIDSIQMVLKLKPAQRN